MDSVAIYPSGAVSGPSLCVLPNGLTVWLRRLSSLVVHSVEPVTQAQWLNNHSPALVSTAAVPSAIRLTWPRLSLYSHFSTNPLPSVSSLSPPVGEYETACT